MLHGNAEIGRGVVVQANRQRRIGGLFRCFHVGDAGHLGDFQREVVDQRGQRLGVRAEQIHPYRSIEAKAELDAGNGFKRGADRTLDLFLRTVAVGELGQLEVHPGVVAAILGADGSYRQRNLGNSFEHFLDLSHLAVGVFEARSHRRVQAQRQKALIGLGYEFSADQRHDHKTGEEAHQCDKDHLDPMQ